MSAVGGGAEVPAASKRFRILTHHAILRLPFAVLRNTVANAKVSSAERRPMRRRDVIPLIGSVVAWPLGAWAQQPALPVIGYLISRSQADFAGPLAAFRQGLQQAGFTEGRAV